jgi:prevent-host-death family protein
MRSVGLKVLKNKLSEYVRLVQTGETVLITDRDRVVAEIVPPRESPGARVSDVRLAEAIRKGVLRPPAGGSGPPPRKPVAPLSELMAELEDDRSDR